MMKYQNKTVRSILFCMIVLVLLPSTGHSQEVAIPSRGQDYVSDFANLMTPSDKNAISGFARELEKKTTAQIAVVTVLTTKPETIQGFSVRLFDKWGIGQKGEDNGILFLIAVKDREAWITTGYGMEGAIPDIIAQKIVQEGVLPYFRKDQYSSGIKEGSIAIISLAAKEYNVKITGQEEQVYQTVHKKKSLLSSLFTILFFIFIIGMRTRLLPYLIFGMLLGGRRRGGFWYGSGMGGSRGGFGGGFGGFGGGMTGGGGGGGSW